MTKLLQADPTGVRRLPGSAAASAPPRRRAEDCAVLPAELVASSRDAITVLSEDGVIGGRLFLVGCYERLAQPAGVPVRGGE